MDACRKTAEATATATYQAWGEQVGAEKQKSVESISARFEEEYHAIGELMQQLTENKARMVENRSVWSEKLDVYEANFKAVSVKMAKAQEDDKNDIVASRRAVKAKLQVRHCVNLLNQPPGHHASIAHHSSLIAHRSSLSAQPSPLTTHSVAPYRHAFAGQARRLRSPR